VIDTTTPVARFPLSRQQEYLWEGARFRSLGRSVASRANPFIALDLAGELRPERLLGALEHLTARHESLRTTLSDEGPQPSQLVRATIRPPLASVDLADAGSPEQILALAHALVAGHRASEFDFVNGPLWSCLLVKMAPERHVLALSMSHLIIDGVALISLVRQLQDVYAGKELAPLKGQYRDFVEQSRLPDADLECKLGYWREQLLPLPGRLEFPTDHGTPPAPLLAFATEDFRSPLGADRLRQLSRSLGVTPFALNVAAYALLLARPSKAPRVVLGSSVARLDLKPDEDAVGYFLDIIHIPVHIRGSDTLGDLADQVRASVVSAQENMVPFLDLARALNPDFDRQRPWPGINLYDAWLRGRVFETNASATSATFGETTVTLFKPRGGSAPRAVERPEHRAAYGRYYLPSLYLNDAVGHSCYLEYNRALHDAGTALRLTREHTALVGLFSSPETRVSEAWSAFERGDAALRPQTSQRTIIS
jgi:hypothetical protein